MMARQSASLWPIRQVRTLANLQMEALRVVATVLTAFATPQKKQPGRPAGETHPLVSHPLSRLGPFETALPNHRQHILRYRIECRHRLRVRLERPLRDNQIRKLC